MSTGGDCPVACRDRRAWSCACQVSPMRSRQHALPPCRDQRLDRRKCGKDVDCRARGSPNIAILEPWTTWKYSNVRCRSCRTKRLKDGCISVRMNGFDAELSCTECGAIVGALSVEVLRLLLGLDGACQTCPHCGAVNVFPAPLGCSHTPARVAAGVVQVPPPAMNRPQSVANPSRPRTPQRQQPPRHVVASRASRPLAGRRPKCDRYQARPKPFSGFCIRGCQLTDRGRRVRFCRGVKAPSRVH
jgi:hypothetical protein